MSTFGALSPGTVFARDFTIVRPLSEGGMGAVYVVTQLSTGAPRALKLMHRELVRDPRLRERFEQEARVGARIASEHVVQVLAAGIDEALGMPWLVMELLTGHDLASLIAERGPLPPEDVQAIFAQLTHAVAAAHRVGIVHRDLKPENIFVAVSHREGAAQMVKVLDFGIAKVVAEAKASTTQALGTPMWMAPEQTETGRSITPATDVWALGLIAFRMFTAMHYWVSANNENATPTMVLREAILDPIQPASSRAAQYGRAGYLPPGFDAWFARCLDRTPEARFPDADAAREAWTRMMAGTPPPQPAVVAHRPATAPVPFEPPRGATVATPHGYAPGAPYGAAPSYPYATPAPTPVPPTVRGRPASGRGLASAVGFGGLLLVAAVGVGVRQWSRADKIAVCDAGKGGRELLEACRVACDMDAVRGACAKHGDLARRDGDPASLADAKRSYARGCNAGDLASCAGRGALLDLEGDDGAAIDAYGRACEGKVQTGCIGLGRHLENGGGVTRDLGRALALYEAACAADEPEGRASCARLALAQENQPLPRPSMSATTALYRKAAADVAAACERHDLPRCVEYGFMRQTGRGVDPNVAAAADLFRRACEGGVASGCTNAAVLAVSGADAPTRWPDALATLRKACEGGGAAACNDAAVLEAGLPFVVRQQQGESLLAFACSATVPFGCSDVGVVTTPPPVTADLARAVEHLARACKAGVGVACANLGAMSENGAGTPKSRPRARELYAQACAGGSPLGCGGPPGGPFRKGETWVGSYTCAQGLTDVALRVVDTGADGHLSIVFEFDYGKGTVRGRYLGPGRYDASTGSFELSPGTWLEQPPRYVMVGARGEVSAQGRVMVGQMDAASCGAIRVVRQMSDVVSSACAPGAQFVEGHGCVPTPRAPLTRTALGTWTGNGVQAGGHTWPFEARFTSLEGGLCGTATYGTLGCTASWYCLAASDGGLLRAREIIETGQRQCDQTGTIEMRVAEDGQTASWSWTSPLHAGGSTAKLSRAAPP
jgi:TPR repeat protein